MEDDVQARHVPFHVAGMPLRTLSSVVLADMGSTPARRRQRLDRRRPCRLLRRRPLAAPRPPQAFGFRAGTSPLGVDVSLWLRPLAAPSTPVGEATYADSSGGACAMDVSRGRVYLRPAP